MKIDDLRNEIDSFKEKVKKQEDEIRTGQKNIQNMNEFMGFRNEVDELCATYDSLCDAIDTEEKNKLKSELKECKDYLSYLKKITEDLMEYYDTLIVDNPQGIEKDWNSICILIADRYNNEVINNSEKLSELYPNNNGFFSLAAYFKNKYQKNFISDVSAAKRNIESKREMYNAFVAKEKENIEKFLKIDKEKFDAMESLDEQIDYLKKVMHTLETSKGKKRKVVVNVATGEWKYVLAEFANDYDNYNTQLIDLTYKRESDKDNETSLQGVSTLENNDEYNLEFASKFSEESPIETVESMENIDVPNLAYVNELESEDETLSPKAETKADMEVIDFNMVNSMVEKYTKEKQVMDENNARKVEKEIRNLISHVIQSPKAETICISLKNDQALYILESDVNIYNSLAVQYNKDDLDEIINRVLLEEGYQMEQNLDTPENSIEPEEAKPLDSSNEEEKNKFDFSVTQEEMEALLSGDLFEEENEEESFESDDLHEEKTFEIEWNRVSRMSYKEEYAYFNAIAEQIVEYSKENPNNQISIELGGFTYTINAAHEELFKMCHERVADAWSIGNAALGLDNVNRTLLGVSNSDVKQNRKIKKYISKIKAKRKAKKKSKLTNFGKVALASLSALVIGGLALVGVNIANVNAKNNAITSDEETDSITKILGENVQKILSAVEKQENSNEEDSYFHLTDQFMKNASFYKENNYILANPFQIDLITSESEVETDDSTDELEKVEDSYTTSEEENYINYDENYFISQAHVYRNKDDAAARENPLTAYFPADSKHNMVFHYYEYEGKLLLLDPEDSDYSEQKEYYESRGAKFLVSCTYNENSTGYGYEGYYNMEEVEELQRSRHL